MAFIRPCRLRSRSCRPSVPMMKTADARQGSRLARFGRAWLNRSARRRRLLQPGVRSVFLVIGDMFTTVAIVVIRRNSDITREREHHRTSSRVEVISRVGPKPWCVVKRGYHYADSKRTRDFTRHSRQPANKVPIVGTGCSGRLW